MDGEATRLARRSQPGLTDAVIEAALASTLGVEVEGARWYQGKGRELLGLGLVDRFDVPGSEGAVLAIVTAEYADARQEEYALVLRADPGGRVRGAEADDLAWPALARLSVEGGSIEGREGSVDGEPAKQGSESVPRARGCRALGADQSNTSLVLDETIVLKCYRRLRSGAHPEQELLRGLTRVGSTRAPSLLGALAYANGTTRTALATTYEFVAGDPIGWEPTIGALAAALGGPAAVIEQLAAGMAEVGRCAADLHRDLFAAFGGGAASRHDASAAHARAVAGLSEAIAVVARSAPELAALGPAAERALAGLSDLEGARLQRIHGDLHLGQLLRGPAGVVAIDFEGDPTLAPTDRRRPASALQDIASLLLSLDHVAAAAARRRTDLRTSETEAFAWGASARETLTDAYDAVLRTAEGSRSGLLRALEVEKEWRELVYAARVVPEWLYAPRLVLQRLLA